MSIDTVGDVHSFGKVLSEIKVERRKCQTLHEKNLIIEERFREGLELRRLEDRVEFINRRN